MYRNVLMIGLFFYSYSAYSMEKYLSAPSTNTLIAGAALTGCIGLSCCLYKQNKTIKTMQEKHDCDIKAMKSSIEDHKKKFDEQATKQVDEFCKKIEKEFIEWKLGREERIENFLAQKTKGLEDIVKFQNDTLITTLQQTFEEHTKGIEECKNGIKGILGLCVLKSNVRNFDHELRDGGITPTVASMIEAVDTKELRQDL